MKRTVCIGWLSLFILLVGVFFYQTFTGGKLPVPTDTLVGLYHPWRDTFAAQYTRGVPFKNFLITDPIRQQIPWRKLVIDSWKSGRLPAWNPYTFVGVPLNANIQAAPFYPLNILFFLFSFPVAWTMLIIVQPLLSGILLFWYLHRQKLSPVAALVGALSWAFGGFAIAWMTWGTITQTALWSPLMFLAVDELLSFETRTHAHPKQIRWAIVLALSIVMTVTAGHAQVAMYMLVLGVCYAWWRIRSVKNNSGLRWIGLGVGTAILLIALQWVPLLRFLPATGRVAALDNWKTVGWFLPWQHLVQFVAPDFFGNPATLNYWGVWNYGEFIGYIGMIPFVFAIAAIFLPGVPMFFSIALAVALLFMVPNPIAGLLFVLHVPFFSILQPTRLMVIVDLSLAILAAYGVDALIKHTNRARLAFAVAGLTMGVLWSIVLAGRFVWHDPTLLNNLFIAKRNLVLPTLLLVAGAVWYFSKRYMRRGQLFRMSQALLIIIVVFDLFRFGWKFTPFTSTKYFFPQTRILQYIKFQPGQFRVMSLDDRILPPNAASYYGIESIEGYDPIAPKRYENFLAAFELGKADFNRASGFNRIYTVHNIDSALLPYLNVRYVLALADMKRPYVRKVMQEGEVRLYEYTKSLPRVYLADTIRLEIKPEDILNTLIAASGSSISIVEKPIEVMSIPISADEGVMVIKYEASRLRLRTTTANPRLVVILNAYNPGWSATVDGKPTSVMPVNYLFTGLVVPAGTHEVNMTYR